MPSPETDTLPARPCSMLTARRGVPTREVGRPPREGAGVEHGRDRRDDDEETRTGLESSVSFLLEEARMLLPGTQTLFGFQLAVVFTQTFRDLLAPAERYLHLVGMVLTAVAIALLMAPAAYHRQAEPESVSRRFVRLATHQLVWGAAPLAVALCIEVYLAASLITARQTTSAVIAVALLGVFVTLWYAVPRRLAAASEARR